MATKALQLAEAKARAKAKRRTAVEAAKAMLIRPVAPPSMRVDRGTYDGSELTRPASRPGADDHMALPSRSGRILYFRDGTVKTIS